MGCRIIATSSLTFLTDFNLSRDRMNRCCRIIHVRDRTCWWNSHTVLVVQTVFHYQITKSFPHLFSRNFETIFSKQLFDLLGLWSQITIKVLIEINTASVIRLLKTLECFILFLSNLATRQNRVVVHSHEEQVCEVNRSRTAIHDTVMAKESMEIHCTQTNGMGHLITVINRRNTSNVR